MIEFCTKKRMLISIIVLIVISILVLIIESSVSTSTDMKNMTDPPDETSNRSNNKDYNCAEHEPFTIIEECTICSKFEIMSNASVCLSTGFREKIHCTVSKKEVSRSCSNTRKKERDFWTFELLMILLGAVSYGSVFMRQKHLDKRLMDKVHQQIAAGV
ncbi:unnamed protein product [Owenia fusiformis]|uniref:Protein JTB n=1 Tax=Owenia fusiformis TaxID=6347 RepID=A0A8J1XU93_OWEFU|nr:unnamed protein product [Owenia fusiformis]